MSRAVHDLSRKLVVFHCSDDFQVIEPSVPKTLHSSFQTPNMTSTPSSRGSLHSNPSTPPRSGSPTPSYLPSSLASSVSNLLRRISTPASSTPTLSSLQTPTSVPHATSKRSDDAFYTPPNRHASPFQPPPLYPLSLRSHHSSSSTSSAILLSCALAEEIRLLIPPRLQLVESWDLAYSLDHDGVSLATLYKKCDELRGVRRGYVLVVKAGDGGVCPFCFCLLLIPRCSVSMYRSLAHT